MHTPIQLGISDYFYRKVTYEQFKPASRHSRVVQCYWQLSNVQELTKDFIYQILPDACIDIVFTVGVSESATIMTPSTSAETINLGRNFNYAGIRLKVGAWRNAHDIIGHQLMLDQLIHSNTADMSLALGDRPMVPMVDELDELAELDAFVDQLQPNVLVEPNPVVTAIVEQSQVLSSVDDMARLTGYSSRQLQRIIRQETGFSPHDLLKIIRFQRSFHEDSLALYSDQSHYIRDFKQRTGNKPSLFHRTYHQKMSEKSNTASAERTTIIFVTSTNQKGSL